MGFCSERDCTPCARKGRITFASSCVPSGCNVNDMQISICSLMEDTTTFVWRKYSASLLKLDVNRSCLATAAYYALMECTCYVTSPVHMVSLSAAP